MPDCAHQVLNLGPQIPLRWGSSQTEVCADCGAWRMLPPERLRYLAHSWAYRWRLPDEMEE